MNQNIGIKGQKLFLRLCFGLRKTLQTSTGTCRTGDHQLQLPFAEKSYIHSNTHTEPQTAFTPSAHIFSQSLLSVR